MINNNINHNREERDMKIWIVTTNNTKYNSEIADIVRAFNTFEKARMFAAELAELCHRGIKVTEREIE